jgi:hypothetical protein
MFTNGEKRTTEEQEKPPPPGERYRPKKAIFPFFISRHLNAGCGEERTASINPATTVYDAVHASPHPTISGDVHSKKTEADHVYKRRKTNHRRTGKAAPRQKTTSKKSNLSVFYITPFKRRMW